MRELTQRNAWWHEIERNRKSENEEGKEELLCEVKTAIWYWDENGV